MSIVYSRQSCQNEPPDLAPPGRRMCEKQFETIFISTIDLLACLTHFLFCINLYVFYRKNIKLDRFDRFWLNISLAQCLTYLVYHFNFSHAINEKSSHMWSIGLNFFYLNRNLEIKSHVCQLYYCDCYVGKKLTI